MASRSGELPEIVSLFPLPDHVFLPGVPVPYRMFEARYRALARDLLRLLPSERWIAIPRLRPGFTEEEYAAAPAFFPVAAIGRVIHCALVPGGQYHVVVHGIDRVELEEIDSPHLYRLARVQPYADDPAAGSDREAHRAAVDALHQSVLTLVGMLGPPAHELGKLVAERDDERVWLDNLASVLLSETEDRHRFLISRSTDDRIDILLGQLATLLHLVATRKGGKDQLPEG